MRNMLNANLIIHQLIPAIRIGFVSDMWHGVGVVISSNTEKDFCNYDVEPQSLLYMVIHIVLKVTAPFFKRNWRRKLFTLWNHDGACSRPYIPVWSLHEWPWNPESWKPGGWVI